MRPIVSTKNVVMMVVVANVVPVRQRHRFVMKQHKNVNWTVRLIVQIKYVVLMVVGEVVVSAAATISAATTKRVNVLVCPNVKKPGSVAMMVVAVNVEPARVQHSSAIWRTIFV